METPIETPVKKRNKVQTQQKLIEAVGRIIIRDGFQNVGINAVSKEAGVDKVLIYRYFGDIEGLLKAFALQKDYWASNEKLFGLEIERLSTEQLIGFCQKIFTGFYRNMIESPELQEISRWELIEKNEITLSLYEQREIITQKLLSLFMQKIPTETELDIPVLSTLLAGAVYFLGLQSKETPTFGGVPLHGEAGQERIEKGIEVFVRLILEKVFGNINK